MGAPIPNCYNDTTCIPFLLCGCKCRQYSVNVYTENPVINLQRACTYGSCLVCVCVSLSTAILLLQAMGWLIITGDVHAQMAQHIAHVKNCPMPKWHSKDIHRCPNDSHIAYMLRNCPMPKWLKIFTGDMSDTSGFRMKKKRWFSWNDCIQDIWHANKGILRRNTNEMGGGAQMTL